MKFHEKLEHLCERKRWSQRDLAKAAGGVSPSTMSNWFSGRSEPDLSAAHAIARALGVSLDYLADDDATEPSAPPPNTSAEMIAIAAIVQALGPEKALRRLIGDEPKAETEKGVGE
jgi:transcriptional regulator with XRE-family HTH domain